MAFVLSIIKVEDALKKPGCAICRLEHEAALRAIDSLLWENITDPESRKAILQSRGFCPQHTRMLVAHELSTSGPLLGVNIIYESLANHLSQELDELKRKQKPVHWLQDVLKSFAALLPARISKPVLNGKTCPICSSAESAGKNSLATLFQTLQGDDPLIKTAYQASPGICLSHIRIGLEMFSDSYPVAADFLIDDAVSRLHDQQSHMKEFIRKQSWENRSENLTEAERSACLKTLTFFTGQSADKFNHHIDEF